MQVILNSKNFEITSDISDYVEKRFVKLKKYFDGLIELHINLIKEGRSNDFTAEVTLFGDAKGRGVVLHSEDKRDDLYQAIDMVEDKLERQLKKYKEKLKVRKTKKSLKRRIIEERLEEPEIPPGEDRVIFKTMNNKPMNSEEAVLQLKNSDLHFLVFNNTDNGKINVVYKRGSGEFVIITP